jgi:hypothetical protein
MGADTMMVVIERAMAAGNSVLIENMGESIDAALNPVITRCFWDWPCGSRRPASLADAYGLKRASALFPQASALHFQLTRRLVML